MGKFWNILILLLDEKKTTFCTFWGQKSPLFDVLVFLKKTFSDLVKKIGFWHFLGQKCQILAFFWKIFQKKNQCYLDSLKIIAPFDTPFSKMEKIGFGPFLTSMCLFLAKLSS